MKFVQIVLCSLLLVSVGFSQTTQPASQEATTQQAVVSPQKAIKSVAEQLQDLSVTLNTGTSEGSGVVIKRGDKNFVLTAGHVIDNLRKTRSVIDPKTGTERKVVEFDDANIIQTLYEDGRKVGKIEMLARVISFSDAENGEDLAVLLIAKKNFINASAVFYSDKDPTPVGSELYHVGSLQGQLGSNSVTTGIISQVGRLFQNKLYDQTSCPAFPGSSGGGVFLKDGRYVGMLVRGGGETFNLIVPVRRIKAWTEKMGLQFILDPNLPVPSDEDLKKIMIEDTGKIFSAEKQADKPKTVNTEIWMMPATPSIFPNN